MKDTNTIHLRSDEVQEILSRPPHALIRYGIGVISLIILLAFITSFFFAYPDKITGEVTVTENAASSVNGRVLISVNGAGKVKTGQLVMVKIHEYPYLEYGMLKARVSSSTKVHNQPYYCVEIDFEDKLITTSGRLLQNSSSLSGTAEIITHKQSLMKRILEPVMYVLRKK